MKFKIFLVFLCFISIFFSIATEIRMIKFKNVNEISINRLSNRTAEQINDLNISLSKIESYFEPGGIVERYIIANDFLEKNMRDIDLIITSLQKTSTEGYIQLYVIGHEEVWVSFRNAEGFYIFQGNLKPGLNPQRFYFFKTPTIDTRYTYEVQYNSRFTSGDRSRVFFLIQETGQSRLIAHPNKSIDHIKTDLNLYIPGMD